MFWVKQPLPDWTELVLILVYPTILAILAERSQSADAHVMHSYFVVYAFIMLLEILINDGIFKYVFCDSIIANIV